MPKGLQRWRVKPERRVLIVVIIIGFCFACLSLRLLRIFVNRHHTKLVSSKQFRNSTRWPQKLCSAESRHVSSLRLACKTKTNTNKNDDTNNNNDNHNFAFTLIFAETFRCQIAYEKFPQKLDSLAVPTFVTRGALNVRVSFFSGQKT